MKKRLGMIDLLRIIAVVVIFLFHSNIHMGCNFSILTPFINMGAIFMTAFFMISGFSIYYVSSDKDRLDTKNEIVLFYKKRMVSIMPMYWFIVFIYPIWDIVVNKGSVVNNILLAPIEFLGLQSVFQSLFGYTHNGGTWFVSCILFCYIVFPFVYNFVLEISVKAKIIFGTISGCILLYSPFLVEYLCIDNIYSNPYFRILEFVIGMLICSIWLIIKDKKWYMQYIACRRIFWGIFAILIIFTTILVNESIFVGNYMVYSIIGLPCFSIMILSGAGIDSSIIDKSKLVKYAVDISYAFFFAQFYAWKITMVILNIIGVDMNLVRITVSFMLCVLIAIIMHEIIEKPLKNILSKKILK